MLCCAHTVADIGLLLCQVIEVSSRWELDWDDARDKQREALLSAAGVFLRWKTLEECLRVFRGLPKQEEMACAMDADPVVFSHA